MRVCPYLDTDRRVLARCYAPALIGKPEEVDTGGHRHEQGKGEDPTMALSISRPEPPPTVRPV